MGRFTQAISEGDGISVIPLLEGDVQRLAALAAAVGAEAVAVEASDVGQAREGTALPIVALRGDPGSASADGADACIVVFDAVGDEGERLEHLLAQARDLSLDCAVDVRDEEELAGALERVDPDIVLISEHDVGDDDELLERTLDLLADVPAGKLVISEAHVVSREQVIALERAGVDAVLVPGLGRANDFSGGLEELVRGSGAHR
jgi:indole-3-glycerol phosphate synthase